MESPLLEGKNVLLKRAFDVLFIFLTLPLTFPIFSAIWVLLRISGHDQPIFRQKRIGRDGKIFNCLKFRTMVRDADKILKKWLDENHNLKAEFERNFKIRRDPRITGIGKFLRRTSLDELPQLINILRGEMSLVGPRPIVAEEVQKYGDSCNLLFRVKPGLTGLWQINGRNDVSYPERVNFDMEYIKNWSFRQDFFILVRTLKVVILGRGAY